MRRRRAIILAVVTWLAQAGETWLGGPYVVNVSPRAATVVRIVRPAEVKLGLEPDLLGEMVPTLRAEKVTLGGLKPGTSYYCEIAGLAEGRGRFKTPPERDTPFRFVVYSFNWGGARFLLLNSDINNLGGSVQHVQQPDLQGTEHQPDQRELRHRHARPAELPAQRTRSG